MKTVRWKTRPVRGFALVLAVSIMALLLTLVDLLQDSAVTDHLTTVYEVADIQADYIAEAGLARVASYLSALGAAEPDFDRALDPGLNTTCAYTGTTAAITYAGTTTDDHMPPFLGGTATNEVNPNLPFLRVPFAGGAYYIRVDDNSDDGHEGWQGARGNNNPVGATGNRNNYFPAGTNNRETGGPLPPANGQAGQQAMSCPEAASQEIDRLRDNQARDRDKIVIVTVVGIYPGAVFAGAQARRSYRLIMSPFRQVPAVAAQINVTAGSGVKLCGASGGAHANGNVTLNTGGGACQCGDLTAANTVSNNPSTCALATCTVPVGCAPASRRSNQDPLIIPPLVDGVGPANARQLMEPALWNNMNRTAAEECYFYLARNGMILRWDHQLTAANGNLCGDSAAVAALGAVPDPCANVGTPWSAIPTTPAGAMCDCWIPVFYPGSNIETVVNAYQGLTPSPYETATGGDQPAVAGACAPDTDCSGLLANEWVPYNPGVTLTPPYAYNYASGGGLVSDSCAGFSGPPTLAAAGWRFDAVSTGTGIATWTYSGAATDNQLPDAVYFVDGLPGDHLQISPIGDPTLTMRIITPMNIRITNNVKIQAPTWSPNFVILSSSNINPNVDGCQINTTASLRGSIVCRGNVGVAGTVTLNGSVVSTNGSVALTGNSTRVNMNLGLLSWITIPVKPVVWSEGTF